MFNPKDNLSKSMENLEKIPREKLLEVSEVSMLLKGYNYIFSDFDPRGMHERSISDDFLQEARKAVVDRGGGEFELNFMIPHNVRSQTAENVIKKRLHEYFHQRANQLFGERRKKVRRGLFFAVTGLVLMFIATWLLFLFKEQLFIFSFLVVLLEPAGWFFFWEGLDDVVFEADPNREERNFYQKMTRAKISFLGY